MTHSQALTVSNVGRAVQNFDEDQLDLIKKTLLKGGSANQLALFVQVCNRTGLDPFAKQIYAIIRKNRVKQGGEWVEVPQMTIQTGIDGYRLIAQRTGEFEGFTQAEWCDEAGVFSDVWLDDDKPPTAARIGVWRRGFREPVTFTARYKEFRQTKDEYNGSTKTGRKIPNDMWANMPANQLRKCAEAGALRAAFPQECAGVYVDAEAGAGDHVYSTTVERETEAPARMIAMPRATDEEEPEPLGDATDGEYDELPFDEASGEEAAVESTTTPPAAAPPPEPEVPPEPAVATAPRRARSVDDEPQEKPAPKPKAGLAPPQPEPLTYAEFDAEFQTMLAGEHSDMQDVGMVLNIGPTDVGLKKWFERTQQAGRITEPVEFIRKSLRSMRGE